MLELGEEEDHNKKPEIFPKNPLGDMQMKVGGRRGGE